MKILIPFFLVLFYGNIFAQTFPDKIGIGLGGIGGETMEFTDASKTIRSFDGTSLDESGFPTQNFSAIVYDMRPCCPWIGSVDDPYKFVPALMAGTYKLIFNGKATITSIGDPVLIQNQHYDEALNISVADIIVQKDKWLVDLNFSNTQRTSTSAVNTGITNIKLLRPGYHNRPNDTFRQEFLNAISHFPVIRYMDFVGTNNSNPNYPVTTEWKGRRLTSDPLFNGISPWEYVIRLANLTGKDVWINIPVAAGDDYIKQLAKLLKDSLSNPSCKIYIEYSNEVWNGGFSQYFYNRNAAIAEVKAESSGGTQTMLNDEAGQCDKNDTSLWCGRRYVKRLKEIGDLFTETFSPGDRSSFETRIRPVFAWQIGGWIPYYSCILKWFEYAYGPARNYFYGLAGAAYVNAESAASNATVPAILSQMTANSDASLGSKRDNPDAWLTGSGKKGLREIADLYNIKLLQYEMGPDNGGGDATNISNKIAANRSSGMKTLLIREIRDNWFANPEIAGDLSMYFVLCSSYTRYGCWGATEEIENMHTPKLQALYEIMGITEDVTGPSMPANVQKTMNGNDAVITWEASTDNVAVTHYRISDNTGALATVLANEPLTVTLKNYNSANLNTIKVTAIDAFNNVSGYKLSNNSLPGNNDHSFIYPNPAKYGMINITLPPAAKNCKLSLYDMEGRERKQITNLPQHQLSLNLDGLANGLYLLKIESNSFNEVFKFLKE